MIDTPKSLGYRFPAEWEAHEATWLTYPVHEASFPGKMDVVLPSYHNFIRFLSYNERVKINVHNQQWLNTIKQRFIEDEIDVSNIELIINSSDDVWCRDHGPSFVVNPQAENKKAIVRWRFNAWGGKYPHLNDSQIVDNIIKLTNLKSFDPSDYSQEKCPNGIIMEGGSIETNGQGTLLTTEACLLNPNRNPNLSKKELENILCQYYGVDKILWLNSGIEGDDTDGHIDDMTRFFCDEGVITVVETNKKDINYQALQDNLQLLSKMRTASGKQLDIVELPMPDPVIWEGNRLPASYANFYIANKTVIVPTFRCKKDDRALEIIAECFPNRRVIGIDSTDIVWGFGSFHCLSQQEPAV